MILIDDLTKDYGNNLGIFNVKLGVKTGNTLGVIGTNGAGKTTLLRCLMGFIKPTSGDGSINGRFIGEDTTEIMTFTGYVPGEIAFPDLKSGDEFLRLQAKSLRMQDLSHAKELVKALKLDTSANLKRMSKGMKQKTALVEAFMRNPSVLLLDEPTTGLDPLMRESFIDITKKAQKNGTTIIMTSHLFEELEELCNKVALIENGRIKNGVYMEKIKRYPYKEFRIGLEDVNQLNDLCIPHEMLNTKDNEVTIKFHYRHLNQFIKNISKIKINYLIENKYSLERYFNEFVLESEKQK